MNLQSKGRRETYAFDNLGEYLDGEVIELELDHLALSVFDGEDKGKYEGQSFSRHVQPRLADRARIAMIPQSCDYVTIQKIFFFRAGRMLVAYLTVCIPTCD